MFLVRFRSVFFSSTTRRPPRSTLLPYTTLFRSLLAGRLLHLPLTQTILVSCGFSICGAAAVAAASSALEGTARGARDDREQDRSVQAERGGVQLETQTATAIALVVLFGTLMIPLVPLLAVALDLPAPGSGTWAGASILEVAQVVAAGSMMGTDALGAAGLERK